MSYNLRCPRCGAKMTKATAFSGAESEFWYVCERAPKCNTYYNAFKPMPHQNAVLKDGHKFVGNFGGYGSAKSYTTRQLIYKHLFITQKANVLVGANVSSQYKQTIQRELEADIPKAFVKKYNSMDQYMELQNGSRLIYRPLDDVDKLRSLNLSAFFIIEGSEVNKEAFTQLKSRLRNMNAAECIGVDGNGVPLYKWYRGQGVVESNPDSGWIRSEILEKSSNITQHGTGNAQYLPDKEHADPAISTHISSSDANIYLPQDYIRDLCANKPSWWIDRYIYGSFAFANGLVFPKYKDAIIPSFDVPTSWKKCVGHDPGLVDASAFVNIAIDPDTGTVHVYRDRQYHDMGVSELHERWLRDVAYDIPATAWLAQPVMDGKMHGRRMFTDKRTLDQMWADYDVFYQPGHIQVLDRIWRIQTYLEQGKIKIHDCCEHLLRELPEYKWKVNNKDGAYKESPIDKNNHSIDALEFVMMILPEDPKKLLGMRFFSPFEQQQKQQDYYDPFAVVEDETSGGWY